MKPKPSQDRPECASSISYVFMSVKHSSSPLFALSGARAKMRDYCSAAHHPP